MEENGSGEGGSILRFEPEAVIIREGEVNPDMYKIIKGKAVIYTDYGTDKESVIGIIGEQACFGEFGLLLHKPSIYTVVAYGELCVMRINEGRMGDFVQTNHKNIIEIMRNMAGTMMIMRKQIDMLADELAAASGNSGETVATKDIIRGYVRPAYSSIAGMLSMIPPRDDKDKQ